MTAVKCFRYEKLKIIYFLKLLTDINRYWAIQIKNLVQFHRRCSSCDSDTYSNGASFSSFSIGSWLFLILNRIKKYIYKIYMTIRKKILLKCTCFWPNWIVSAVSDLKVNINVQKIERWVREYACLNMLKTAPYLNFGLCLMSIYSLK